MGLKKTIDGRLAKGIVVVLTVAVSSCSKPGGALKTGTGDACSKYAAGHIIVGIYPVADMENVFALFNSSNLPISQLSYFDYDAPDFSAADIPYLDSILNTKPYIQHGGWHASISADYLTGALSIRNMYWNMDLAAQTDWLKTVADLRLRQVVGQPGQVNEFVLAIVPAGQEKYWLNALRAHAVVKSTELDCIEDINGFP
jgi:hypothetical protein